MAETAICHDCGVEGLANDERVFIDPHTYCLDCFDATCDRCNMSIVDSDNRVQKFGEYLCKECAERLCIDCGKYIDNLENRYIVTGSVRCEECMWCFSGDLCCGCGSDVSDSIEMVVVDESHQFCADCKSDVSDEASVQEYPFDKNDNNPTAESEKSPPF